MPNNKKSNKFSWQNLITIKPKPDVNNISNTVLLFIWLIIGEQLITAAYISFVSPFRIVGLILSLIIAWLFIKQVIAYQANYNSMASQIKTTLIISIVGTNYLLAILWGQIGPKLLKLSENGQASQNQQSILSFISDPTSTGYIIILTVIIAPLIEEFCFRYLIIKPTKQRYNQIRIIGSIMLFSFMHVAQQIPSIFNHQLTINAWLFYFMQYAITGTMLSLTYNRYRNYKLNVLIHASWNAIAIMTAIIISIMSH